MEILKASLENKNYYYLHFADENERQRKHFPEDKKWPCQDSRALSLATIPHRRRVGRKGSATLSKNCLNKDPGATSGTSATPYFLALLFSTILIPTEVRSRERQKATQRTGQCSQQTTSGSTVQLGLKLRCELVGRTHKSRC